jgi:hypothetical protein
VDTVFGLPAHPLLVHIPIVLVPLATLLAVLAIRPQCRRGALTGAAVLAVVGAVGVVLAIGAGHDLEDRVGGGPAVERHEEAGERAELPTILFAVVTVAGAGVLEWRRRQPGELPELDVRPVDGTTRGGTMTATATAVVERTAAATATWIPTAVLALSIATGVLSTALVLRAGHLGSKAVWSGA